MTAMAAIACHGLGPASALAMAWPRLVLDAPRLWPAALVAAMLCALAVAALYAGQIRPLAGRVRWLLPILRIGALGALAASILQPVAVGGSTADAGRVLILVDNSASMGVTDVRGQTRLQRVQRLLGPDGLASRIPAATLAYTIGESARPLMLPIRTSLAADAASSDLRGGIAQAVWAAGGNVRAIVLFSDGRQNPAKQSQDDELPAHCPIFCVQAASTRPDAANASLFSMRAPASCFAQQSIDVTANVRQSGDSATPAIATLSVDEKTAATRPVANGSNAAIDFPLKLQEAGVHRIDLSIAPTGQGATGLNKRLTRWIKVAQDEIHVGLYCGAPDWDYQYLANALARTPWVQLDRGIFASDADKLQLSPQQISQMNLLILDDVPLTALDARQCADLRQLVADRGGSVLIIAGEQNVVQQYPSNPDLAALLPYATGSSRQSQPTWQDWPGTQGGFHVAFAPDAPEPIRKAFEIEHPQRGPANRDLSALPGFFRYLALPNLKPAAAALLIERDSANPLLVENRLGRGRTFFFAMKESWRWRFKLADSDQDRFWLDLVRYAADEPYAAHKDDLWLDADPVCASPGQPIQIRAKASDPNPPSLRLCQSDGTSRQIPLEIAGGHWTASLDGLGIGHYQLRLEQDGRGVELPIRVQKDYEQELADVSADDAFLRTLADDSGGKLLTMDQLDTLPKLISHTGDTDRSNLAQHRLWDSFYLYAFVVACLASEWAIRKRVGLA